MQLETQRIRDQALALARPIGKAAVAAHRSAQSGLGQAIDARHDLELQLKRLLGRPERNTQKIVVAGALLAIAGVGAAVLASGPVRRAVRGQVDRIRVRLQGRRTASADQPDRDREEELLDDRLDASFPASDPVGANHVN